MQPSQMHGAGRINEKPHFLCSGIVFGKIRDWW